MTLDDRVHALASLGLTPRQTRFVALVALHSGYCLRRQYLTFAGLQYGKNVREFLDGLVARGLARRFTYRRDRGHLYHLCARSIYRAIDQEENRNRRHTSPALIARKLMVLDHVLRYPERDWYATEQDKVALLTEGFGVPLGDLPHRVYTATDGQAGPTIRYFVQKLPLWVKKGRLGSNRPQSTLPHMHSSTGLPWLSRSGSCPASRAHNWPSARTKCGGNPRVS